jgi:hypothetical protein
VSIPQISDDDITYHFTLPCTVSLWGKSSSDKELRERLAAALRDQLMAQDATDIGSIIEVIIAEPPDEERCDECSGTRYPVEVHDDSCSLSSA